LRGILRSVKTDAKPPPPSGVIWQSSRRVACQMQCARISAHRRIIPATVIGKRPASEAATNRFCGRLMRVFRPFGPIYRAERALVSTPEVHRPVNSQRMCRCRAVAMLRTSPKFNSEMPSQIRSELFELRQMLRVTFRAVATQFRKAAINRLFFLVQNQVSKGVFR
jgi:hypothetical protein